MISILLVILLFLIICKIKDDLQNEMKKYLTKEEWEKWLEESISKPQIRKIDDSRKGSKSKNE